MAKAFRSEQQAPHDKNAQDVRAKPSRTAGPNSPQKFNTDEKEIASQVVLEEEGGGQNKDMMLRAPEAVPKKYALPPDTITAHDQI